MSRHSRAGEPGRQRSFRATDSEWSAWESAAKHAGVDLSTWLRQAMIEDVIAHRDITSLHNQKETTT